MPRLAPVTKIVLLANVMTLSSYKQLKESGPISAIPYM
jgi:hypothetical protein